MPHRPLGRVLRARLLLLALATLAFAAPARAQIQQWNGTSFVRVPNLALTADDLNAGKAYATAQGRRFNTTITRQKFVFIGGVGPQFASLADPVANAQMIADGRIGLYEHANGMAALSSAQRAALWNTWGFSGITATGGGQAVGEVGDFVPVAGTTYASYFGGTYPNEVNMNTITNSGDGSGSYTAVTGDAHPGTVYTGYTSASDLARMQASIGAANAAGAQNVAIFMTPNGSGEDLDDPFATSSYWANVRLAALYGGGIALDVPPSYWVARGAAYQQAVRQEIDFARSQHIRSSLTVSPYALTADASGNTGGMGFDPNFLANTQALYNSLASTGSLPSQWIVENYGLGGTENDVQTDTTANSLNAVALWLARNAAPQMQGTALAASNGVADQGLLATTLTNPEAASSLGFMPVQQGTGLGQSANTVKIGWDGVALALRGQVDNTDLGQFAMRAWVTAGFQPIGGTAGVSSFNTRTGAVALSSADVLTALGFTPVQQGTGAGQLANVVKIGWSGTAIKAQVDGTDQGNLASQAYAQALYSGAWTSASEAVAASSGTLTTASGTARYMKLNRTVFVTITASITTNGSGAGAVTVALPFAAGAGAGSLSGREAVSGKMLSGAIAASGSSVSITNYDATYPGASGASIVLSGVYEAAS